MTMKWLVHLFQESEELKPIKYTMIQSVALQLVIITRKVYLVAFSLILSNYLQCSLVRLSQFWKIQITKDINSLVYHTNMFYLNKKYSRAHSIILLPRSCSPCLDLVGLKIVFLLCTNNY